MGFIAAVKSVLGQYATFTGRARRSEFWMFYLFTLIIHTIFATVFTVALVVALAGSAASMDVFAALGGLSLLIFVVWMLVNLALLLPTYAVWARRLHDMGQSGHWLWLNFVSLGIVPLVMAFLESQPGPNAWGPNPKAIEQAPAPAGYYQ